MILRNKFLHTHTNIHIYFFKKSVFCFITIKRKGIPVVVILVVVDVVTVVVAATVKVTAKIKSHS